MRNEIERRLMILPTAISVAFIIGGTQFMFYSLYMAYRRKQNKKQL